MRILQQRRHRIVDARVRRALGARGVRVNCVAPGFVSVPMQGSGASHARNAAAQSAAALHPAEPSRHAGGSCRLRSDSSVRSRPRESPAWCCPSMRDSERFKKTAPLGAVALRKARRDGARDRTAGHRGGECLRIEYSAGPRERGATGRRVTLGLVIVPFPLVESVNVSGSPAASL